MSRRGRAVVALLCALPLPACTASGGDVLPGTDAAPSTTAAEVPFDPCPEPTGRPAPDGPLSGVGAVECLGGGTWDPARAPDRPTVVNLWASWCGPCREELPLVQQLADGAGDRLSVLGLISQDGVPQAVSFAADNGITLPGPFDGDGEVAAALGLRGLPATVLLAPDGSVAHVEVGPVATAEELEGLVAEHLGVTL